MIQFNQKSDPKCISIKSPCFSQVLMIVLCTISPVLVALFSPLEDALCGAVLEKSQLFSDGGCYFCSHFHVHVFFCITTLCR